MKHKTEWTILTVFLLIVVIGIYGKPEIVPNDAVSPGATTLAASMTPRDTLWLETVIDTMPTTNLYGAYLEDQKIVQAPEFKVDSALLLNAEYWGKVKEALREFNQSVDTVKAFELDTAYVYNYEAAVFIDISITAEMKAEFWEHLRRAKTAYLFVLKMPDTTMVMDTSYVLTIYDPGISVVYDTLEVKK